jgi:transcriptional repressor NrdR
VQCPSCGGATNVSETRDAGRHTVRRRRICSLCKQRFTTLEQVAPPHLRVEKRRGGAEPYDRAKLTRCLARVCKRRPGVDEAVIADLVERIEAQLARGPARAVRWSQLAALVLTALAGVDRLAEQRMAANYLDDTGALRLDDAADRRGAEPQLGLFSE